FLLACVLWEDVREGWAQRKKRQSMFPALEEAIDDVFHARIGDVSGRGKLAADMREIWMMQTRFEKRSGASAYGLVEQLRFRAGFDFMRLRADAGEVDEALADWWQQFSLADDNQRHDLIEQARDEQHQRVRARPPKADGTGAAPTNVPGAAESAPATSTLAADTGEAPKKRRRRRPRRTGGDEGGASGAAD
ncbi:MAG: polynucleotide adenylyltransferase PcnB, partial [Betaproteobacteria bacterium]